MLLQSRHLDQIGVFARTLDDAALIAEALVAYDENDPDTRPRARPPLIETAASEPPVTPLLAFVKSPVWDRADESTQAAFEELVEHLGEAVAEVELPPAFADAVDWHRTIVEADIAKSFAREYAIGRDRLSTILREMIERGRSVLAIDYAHAVDGVEFLKRSLDEIFEGYDGFLSPATTGEAPVSLDSTGSPIFCTLWTLCGAPAITLPVFQGPSGMPLGAQLAAPQGGDARLLRTAQWLVNRVNEK